MTLLGELIKPELKMMRQQGVLIGENLDLTHPLVQKAIYLSIEEKLIELVKEADKKGK